MAHPMSESAYCFTHDPKGKQRHIDAARRGGSVSPSEKFTLLDPLDLTDGSKVLELLMDTVNRVRRIASDGSMDTKTANCIGQLARVALEVRRQTEYEERLTKLESYIPTIK